MMAGSSEKDVSIQYVDVTTIDAVKAAHQASVEEHEQTFVEAIKSNHKSVLWSIAISLTIIMEGYDTGLIYQFFAYPSFAQKFGVWHPELNQYVVSSAWQAGLGNGGNVGVILGGFLNGYLSPRYGYKKVILGALVFLNGFIFIVFFASRPEILLLGQILNGLCFGIFATTGPAYASEVCPLQLRGYLTCYVNLCWCIGQLLGAGILYGLLKIQGEWGYRIAYAVQWAWPLPLIVLISFAPESPWFLLRANRPEAAARALRKLDNKSPAEHARVLAQMTHTLRLERDLLLVVSDQEGGGKESSPTYADCFRGVDRRRTEIVCMTFAGQALSGAIFAYGPTYFFVQAGISADNSYGIATGGTGMAFVGTVLSWFLLARYGRRSIYLTGMIVLALCLLVVGIVAAASDAPGAKWVQAALCVTWLFVYSLTVGPICYTIISETSSIRLRAKSVVLSRNFYNVCQLVAGTINPYMINPTEANWKGKTAFFWCGTASLAALWTYFRLPETRGKTYEELDLLFHRKVPARKFAAYEVDAYENELKSASEDILIRQQK